LVMLYSILALSCAKGLVCKFTQNRAIIQQPPDSFFLHHAQIHSNKGPYTKVRHDAVWLALTKQIPFFRREGLLWSIMRVSKKYPQSSFFVRISSNEHIFRGICH
jgi:hypothetical protein